MSNFDEVFDLPMEKGERISLPDDKLPSRKHRWVEALIDPSSGELSMSRIATGLVIFVLTPAMVTLVALGKYPANETTKLILGLLAAPALVYGLNSFGRVKNGLYDGLRDALERSDTPYFGKPQKKETLPDIAAGSDPATLEE